MADQNQTSVLDSVVNGFKLGVIGTAVYLLYRFARPYWYATRIEHWLQVEPDYIVDYSRTIHPLGFYEYEIHLTESDDPEIIIENRSRRVPVIIRATHDFNIEVLGNLEAASEEGLASRFGETRREFFREVQWAMNDAPGVHQFLNHSGDPCDPGQADRLSVEYRIYPDSVSQHEIINSIVEIASAFKMIKRLESEYLDRIDSHR